MSRAWWFSCHGKRGPIACLVVSDEEDHVVGKLSAPIVKRFDGQPIRNLANWFRKLGGFRWTELRQE